MRTRFVLWGLAIIVGFAVVTESVLLIGYAAGAASLLTIVALFIWDVLRRRTPSVESPVPRWGASGDREAA